MAKDIGIWSGFEGMELLREDVGSVIINLINNKSMSDKSIVCSICTKKGFLEQMVCEYPRPEFCH